jgi:hypothetical protein
MLFWQPDPTVCLDDSLPGSRILNANDLLHCLTLWFSVSATLQPEHFFFSRNRGHGLFTAVLNRRLLYKSDIQPHHLKRSYSVGMSGTAKQSSHNQSRDLLLVTVMVTLLVLLRLHETYSRQMYPM